MPVSIGEEDGGGGTEGVVGGRGGTSGVQSGPNKVVVVIHPGASGGLANGCEKTVRGGQHCPPTTIDELMERASIGFFNFF